MPQMNRIRVNNVKYNFGTQCYDDFVMRMHGKNTIYDLANGGGKSVLMLLLLQNLIPNCTLDEKQPIEKLFRTSGGSTTIHSLVEWNLDEGDIKEDYRFMLTGFCARKAKDMGDEEQPDKDTAAIEYFNYCIFYRAYNENDIVNLPLVKDNERITYNGLKNYLKELDKTVADLKVYVFERKGEYLQFISHYGLYESAWEMVRGINKTEGHVRTYFETNYRTTRKVVEDLLIEGIIEKSFRDKTNKEDLNEEMAKTLLDMKDKLVELSKKKGEINRFAHQKELVRVLSGRVTALKDLYIEKEELVSELMSAYAMLREQIAADEQTLKKQKGAIESKGQECIEIDRVIACLKVQLLEEQYDKCCRQQEEAELKVKNAKILLTEQENNINTKENASDYMEYARLQKQCGEQQAVIEKAKEGSGDYVERLYDYASVKKSMMEQRLKETRSKVEELSKKEHEQKVALKALMKEKRSLECEDAVERANLERLSIVVKTKEQQIAKQKKNTNLLLLEDAGKAAAAMQKRLEKAELTLQNIIEQQQTLQEKKLSLSVRQQELTLKREQAQREQNDGQGYKAGLEHGLSRVQALAAAYQYSLQHETPTLEELTRLLAHSKERVGQMYDTMAKCRFKKEHLAKRIHALEQGELIADTMILEELRDYLQTRHEVPAELVQDVISAMDRQEQTELLERMPYAPYGLLLKGADEERLATILQDEQIHSLAQDVMVPLFTEGALLQAELPVVPGMAFLHGDSKGIYEEKGFEKELLRLKEEQDAVARELKELSDMVEVLKEDELFFTEQVHLKRELLKQEDESYSDVTDAAVYDQQLKEIEASLLALFDDEVRLKEEQERLEQEVKECSAEQVSLDKISLLYEECVNSRKEKQRAEEKQKEAADALLRIEAELEQKNRELKEIREMLAAQRETIAKSERQWEEEYAAYYKERPVLDLGYNETQLDIEYTSMREIVEKGMVSVADKQVLVQTLKQNMEQLMRGLRRRGADIAKLEKEYETGSLFKAGEAELNQLYKEKMRYEQQYQQENATLSEAEKKKSKCEGQIEHGMRMLSEQGIHYERLDIAPEEVKRTLSEQQQVFSGLLSARDEMTTQFIEAQKQYNKQLDFYKDIKRMMELYHLQWNEEVKRKELAGYSLEQLKHCQKQFGQTMAKEEKARKELEQYKQQTAATLRELQSYELAEVIHRDVVMPESLSGMEELLNSLDDIVGYLNLEEERVEQGVKDMELIKQSFENQCIRRCQDVKTELARLPQLSSITLSGEQIQMIDLKIPYEPEERLPQKMAEYIDTVVKSIDSYDTVKERMRYIRNQLSLKNLFSVVVTDMNKIRLQLYKRERIKEQSRYLRYEEAVGSTGQSQGIYIQFLIAVINYIANIHSVNSDNNKLGKVIFIDNPFGAAKDIYIWEPIFEMLKTNNVQLIVPARGVTPAITGRFDVNYILGQQLVGDKQQTVVVDYRSQVEKTEMEYKRIQFSQNSFDFI